MSSPPLKEVWPRLTSFASLHAAAIEAQRGKRYRPGVLAFNARLEANLFRLQRELESFTYTPGPYRRFEIRDPKRRLISAAPYRDRVVHHALCAAIAPPLERRFIATTFANRRGLGSHKALRRFVTECGSHRWVLCADIRLYFPSIDLTILRAQLGELIACPSTLWLLDQILTNGACQGPALDAFPGDTLLTPLERPRGLPIGNLTSQFLANLHLNAVDHAIPAPVIVRCHGGDRSAQRQVGRAVVDAATTAHPFRCAIAAWAFLRSWANRSPLWSDESATPAAYLGS